jgi:hypothetical protein
LAACSCFSLSWQSPYEQPVNASVEKRARARARRALAPQGGQGRLPPWSGLSLLDLATLFSCALPRPPRPPDTRARARGGSTEAPALRPVPGPHRLADAPPVGAESRHGFFSDGETEERKVGGNELLVFFFSCSSVARKRRLCLLYATMGCMRVCERGRGGGHGRDAGEKRGGGRRGAKRDVARPESVLALSSPPPPPGPNAPPSPKDRGTRTLHARPCVVIGGALPTAGVSCVLLGCGSGRRRRR